ncbi:MAG: hypothetical protein EOO43_17515 [Flavobacterium sp.]|nr:MAG: hypothetical protein EOO43_17515 [Flavobacterium sp.]
MTKVVLTEKPSVAMDLGKALGRIERHDGYIVVAGYHITWAIGHLVEINEEIAPKQWRLNTLPILPEEFLYKVTSDKINQFNIIKGLLKKATSVVIATDAGREGELIARLILNLSDYTGKIERFWTSEALSAEVVKKEFGANEVVIKEKVNNKLIGGFILKVGDRQFDASISSGLNKLKKEFAQGVV